MAFYRNFPVFILIIFYHEFFGVQSLDLEQRGPTFKSDQNQFNPIRALIYPSYRKTTIEEKREPLLEYALQMASPSRENSPKKVNPLFDRNTRKKRSLGYGIGLLSPSYSGLGYGSYGGYGGYGSPMGYGYNSPYGYGNNYGSYYGYGSGSGYGNYGYGYGSGYGSGYYDPNCVY